MLKCKGCKCDWEEYGKSYKRLSNNKVDYWCSNCGCKKSPFEYEDEKTWIYMEEPDDKEFTIYSPIYNQTENTKNFKDMSSSNFKNKLYDYEEMINKIPSSNFREVLYPKPDHKIKHKNILCVGDLHLPFTLPGYLNFCAGIYDKYDCDHVIFMGDILDNHYSSFHATDPDGLSAADELEFAIKELHKWSDIFPVADVCLGNHDLLLLRKAYDSGMSKRWIKDFKDVLGVEWNFQPSFEYSGVLYRHGYNMKAAPKAGSEMMNVVPGHFHTEAYINYRVGRGKKVFGMQVPVGVNRESYAMAYAREFPKQAIGAAVILECGRLPIIEMMEL